LPLQRSNKYFGGKANYQGGRKKRGPRAPKRDTKAKTQAISFRPFWNKKGGGDKNKYGGGGGKR